MAAMMQMRPLTMIYTLPCQLQIALLWKSHTKAQQAKHHRQDLHHFKLAPNGNQLSSRKSWILSGMVQAWHNVSMANRDAYHSVLFDHQPSLKSTHAWTRGPIQSSQSSSKHASGMRTSRIINERIYNEFEAKLLISFQRGKRIWQETL